MEVEAKYNLNKETDYKFWSEYCLAEKDFATWQAVPESLKQLDMLAVYFDTEDSALSDNYISLRLRKEGDKLMLNLKQDLSRSGALSERKEWEYDLAQDLSEPINISCFSEELPRLLAKKADENSDLAEFLGPFLNKNFIDLGRIEFKRLILDYQKCSKSSDKINEVLKLEWSIDHGFFIAGSRKEEFAEMEFELKEGETADLVALLEDLPKVHPVQAQNLSKRARLQNLCQNSVS